MLFLGTPELHHPVEQVFEQGLLLRNWPQRAERINIHGEVNEELLSLGGLLHVSFKTPIKKFEVDAKVVTLDRAQAIEVVSRSRLANVTVALAFTAQASEHTVVSYEVSVKLGLLGKPMDRFLHESGEQAVDEFVGEFVNNISAACTSKPTSLSA